MPNNVHKYLMEVAENTLFTWQLLTREIGNIRSEASFTFLGHGVNKIVSVYETIQRTLAFTVNLISLRSALNIIHGLARYLCPVRVSYQQT